MKYIILIASSFFLILQEACNNGAATDKSTLKTRSAADKTESKTERNKKTVMACMDAVNAHDPEKIMKDEAPNFVEYGDGTEANSDKDRLKQGLTGIFNTYPDFRFENATYFAEGDEVVVISDFTMTFKNDMGKTKATGKTAKFKDVDIFILDENGKIVSHRDIYPADAIDAQLGVKSEKGQCAEKQ